MLFWYLSTSNLQNENERYLQMPAVVEESRKGLCNVQWIHEKGVQDGWQLLQKLKLLFLFRSGWLTNNNRKNALAHLCFSFLGGRIVVVCWVYEMLPEMNRVVFFTYDFESVLVDCETTLLETKLSLLNHWH